MSLRRRLTSAVMTLGPSNPAVRLVLRARCRPARLRFTGDLIDIEKSDRTIRIAAHQFPFAPDLATRFDTYFAMVESETAGGRSVVDFSRPRLQRYRSLGLEFELPSIPEEIPVLGSYFRWHVPPPGSLIFDMGAYCGVSTYLFAKAVGSAGRVVAFEPDPVSRELLVRNLIRHSVTNVEIVAAAIAGHSGVERFAAEGTMGSTLARIGSRDSLGDWIDVEVLSFADACARYGMPDFVKVDIEGAEIEMFEAATSLLANSRIHFAIDTHHPQHNRGGQLTNEDVERILARCGYETRSELVDGCMTTWAKPRLQTPDL